jgi:hypothetical protein
MASETMLNNHMEIGFVFVLGRWEWLYNVLFLNYKFHIMGIHGDYVVGEKCGN